MKTILSALASAVLLAAPIASISTPATAQFHSGGFHGGNGGFRGGAGGGFHGGVRAGGSYDGGFRGGHHRDRGEGVGILFDAPFVDPYYYGEPYGYDDAYSYDDGASACGWSWDAVHGGYVWVPC